MDSSKNNLYVIWAALFFTMVGMSMVVPFLPFYIRDLGITEQSEVELWSGLAFAGPFIISFFLTPVWGMLGDKYGKKSMVVRAIIGLSISQFLVGMSQDVYQLVMFRMFQGATSGFIPASLALVSSNSPKEKSGYNIGVLQMAISSGTIIGPLIGGIIADITSHRLVFHITGSLCLISGIFVILMVKDTKVITVKKLSVFDNFKYSFNSKTLSTVLVSIALTQMAVSITQPGFALFIESLIDNQDFLSTISGVVFGVTGIATAVSSPLWGKMNDKKGVNRNLFIAMSIGFVALTLHSFVFSYILLIPLRIILGFCIGGMIPVFYSVISNITPDERKGGIMGVASSFTILGNILGPLMYSLITPIIGLRNIFMCAGILLFANIIYINFNRISNLNIYGRIISYTNKEN
ncbi:MAG: MFS transporter [Ignavibacteria bacterium]